MKNVKGMLSSLIGIAGLFLVGVFVFKTCRGVISAQLLKTRAVYIKAVVIDKKNYNPNENIPDGFSYSYRFYVEGKAYEGNALDKALHIGDSVQVEYVRGWPSMNRAEHTGDW
jgi:hypothetical protein